MNQNPQQMQITRDSYRLPVQVIGEIHQLLSALPASQSRAVLNKIDAALMVDEQRQAEEARAEKDKEEQKRVEMEAPAIKD